MSSPVATKMARTDDCGEGSDTWWTASEAGVRSPTPYPAPWGKIGSFADILCGPYATVWRRFGARAEARLQGRLSRSVENPPRAGKEDERRGQQGSLPRPSFLHGRAYFGSRAPHQTRTSSRPLGRLSTKVLISDVGRELGEIKMVRRTAEGVCIGWRTPLIYPTSSWRRREGSLHGVREA